MTIADFSLREKSEEKHDESVQLLSLNLFGKSIDELLVQIENTLVQGNKSGENATRVLTIATPNPEIAVLVQQNPSLSTVLDNFTVQLPDGIGLIWAARILGKAQPGFGRIAGVELVARLLDLIEKTGQSALIIGGKSYAGQKVGLFEVIPVSGNTQTEPKRRSTQGTTLWWTPGFSQIQQQTVEEVAELEAVMAKLRPAVVFVAFGAPHQEEWLIKNQVKLAKNGVKVAMVVGGAFDMLLGKIPRAPIWMQSLGLEWIYRLYQEPWRWKRQLRLLRFLYIVCLEWVRQRKDLWAK
ncbi:WecB/TagA/CpsF family glycosyltransferase [Candidatus Woesebacteria bacterium]|nr:WecB/TagA/CpsF family glycosyltransferase [Candidatus Woesebacteria bacterium]